MVKRLMVIGNLGNGMDWSGLLFTVYLMLANHEANIGFEIEWIRHCKSIMQSYRVIEKLLSFIIVGQKQQNVTCYTNPQNSKEVKNRLIRALYG